MFVFGGVMISKTNCFTAPPGAPREKTSPFGMKNSLYRFKGSNIACFAMCEFDIILVFHNLTKCCKLVVTLLKGVGIHVIMKTLSQHVWIWADGFFFVLFVQRLTSDAPQVTFCFNFFNFLLKWILAVWQMKHKLWCLFQEVSVVYLLSLKDTQECGLML